MGIEPTQSAWKAEVLPLNYTRFPDLQTMVEGEGFEPSKAEPSDLQSDPFDRSGTPPKREVAHYSPVESYCQPFDFHFSLARIRQSNKIQKQDSALRSWFA